MLENAWILPALMVGAFVIILFLGKKLPQGGWWVGQLAVTACLVLSTVAGVQWNQREKVPVATTAEHSAEAATAEGGAAEGGTPAEHADETVTEETHAALSAGGSKGFAVKAASVKTAEEEGPALLREPVRNLITWYNDGNIKIELGSHIDGFAVAMLFVVSFISFCVHIFSREYLRTDSRFVHYFASLALFTAAMLWMVQSATTLGLLFGWEMMGLCSFLLIGHWWEDHNNSTAAVKAFLTTRTGDIGLLIGIIILFWASGQSFDIAHTNHLALTGGIKQSLLLVSACCLFTGVIGKSAQFPLHTWLPDAMAGPTPASSLIHAATMVVAGVYLFGRLYGVFFKGFSIAAGGMNLGAWIGSITIVMAALLAFVQTDIKKVLAYSTVSQLGYMVMGLSVGAWAGAIFHLFTHAFFKALLFQAAGSISHSGSHHSFEMDRMGGLRKYMKWTFGTFTVGYFALCGIPPFSGFFSKDEILTHAKENHFGFAFAAGSVGAFLTAAYMTRVMYKTFFGENRLHLAHDDHGHEAEVQDEHDTHVVDVHAAHAVDSHDTHGAHGDDHGGHDGPQESNWWILAPLVFLAVPALLVGLLQWPGKYWFEHFIANDVFEESIVHNGLLREFTWSVAAPSIALAVGGIVASYIYYVVLKGNVGLVRRFAPARWFYNFLKNKYYLDHLWTGVVVGSIKGPIAKGAYWVNQNVLDGVVNTVGTGAAASGRLVYKYVDQGLVDGLVNGSGSAARDGGGILRILQSGRVQNYAALFLGGVGIIGLALALFV